MLKIVKSTDTCIDSSRLHQPIGLGTNRFHGIDFEPINNATEMDDIEELATSSVSTTHLSQSSVLPQRRKEAVNGSATDDKDGYAAEGVPGTQKVWIKTYGCSHNVSDSEYMEGILSSYGYQIVAEQENADLWLVNSCTVKDPSQAAFMHLVNKAKETNFPVVVAGCVSQADRSIPGLEDVSVVGISQIDRVVEVVEETLSGHTVKLLAKKELPALDLPKIRKNPLVEIVPLSTGCLGACTYCKTKHARGNLGSYTVDTIVDRVRTVVAEGVSEVWLSSEDTGAYGIDLGTDISCLLRAVVAALPDEGVMLRVGMTNPPYILRHLEAVAEILNHPKVFAFLHVPVQAGSDSVLGAMNREYTCDEFRQVADYLLTHVPDVTIATDIICGFPNESEADFDETLALINHYKFAIVNISQFYPRPGTPAARMKRIPTQVVKDRSRRLTKLFETFDPYKSYVGRRERVWFCNEVSDDGRSVGHTKAYVKVLVPLDANLPGTSALVDISARQRFHVEGVVVPGQRLVASSSHRGPPPLIPAQSALAVAKHCDDGACDAQDDSGCEGDVGESYNSFLFSNLVFTNKASLLTGSMTLLFMTIALVSKNLNVSV